jgi:hypothetical protein
MILNILFATTVYFVIGYSIFLFIESQNTGKNIFYFTVSYFVALSACLLYYATWIILDLEAHKGVVGLFSPDSSTYYLDAVRIAGNNFSGDVVGRVITDHYHELFLAVQIYIFGAHVLIPKIYQVLLFSIAVVLWTSIARDILNNQRMEKYFFYFLVFCVPLLTYNAHVLKEISLFFATTVAIYGFTKYHYSNRKSFKYFWVALFGIIFMFFFRRQYALVMFFSFLLATMMGSDISLRRKIIWSVISLIVLFVISAIPIFQQIGATTPLTEGGTIFVGRGEHKVRVAARDTEIHGMFGSAIYLLTNLTVVFPMFIYGIIMMFFHPPFLYTPAEMLERGTLSYLTMGYYNAFFAILLPAFIFGAWYLHKYKRNDPVVISLLLYFILASIVVIFGAADIRRLKISYFWPIAYIYICYGMATYPVWKKHLPLVGLIFAVFFILYFVADIIGWVTL